MPPLFPDLSTRFEGSEWMDDFSIPDPQLLRSLQDLRRTNRFLGGHSSSDTHIDPFLRDRPELRVLDLACGDADYLCHLVRRGDRLNCTVHAVGLDANPVAIRYARAHLDDTLPPSLRPHVQVKTADALTPPYAPDTFDIVHTALFLHHLDDPEGIQLLQIMDRLSRHGLVVNDLHRHLLAYLGFWLFSHLLRFGPMTRHDGLVSVRRGFLRSELKALAKQAHLHSSSIQWHWAFRWTLSTLSKID